MNDDSKKKNLSRTGGFLVLALAAVSVATLSFFVFRAIDERAGDNVADNNGTVVTADSDSQSSDDAGQLFTDNNNSESDNDQDESDGNTGANEDAVGGQGSHDDSTNGSANADEESEGDSAEGDSGSSDSIASAGSDTDDEEVVTQGSIPNTGDSQLLAFLSIATFTVAVATHRKAQLAAQRFDV